MTENLSDSERHEIEDYQKNAIQSYSSVDLSGSASKDDVENFEQKDNYMILMESFETNSIFIDPNYRNTLIPVAEKQFSPNDIVAYKTKDYRVVCRKADNVIIRNSKRMIKVNVSELNYKIKELNQEAISHIYRVLHDKIDMTSYDAVSFLVSFSEVFEIDIVVLLNFLPDGIVERVKLKLANMRDI